MHRYQGWTDANREAPLRYADGVKPPSRNLTLSPAMPGESTHVAGTRRQDLCTPLNACPAYTTGRCETAPRRSFPRCLRGPGGRSSADPRWATSRSCRASHETSRALKLVPQPLQPPPGERRGDPPGPHVVGRIKAATGERGCLPHGSPGRGLSPQPHAFSSRANAWQTSLLRASGSCPDLSHIHHPPPVNALLFPSSHHY